MKTERMPGIYELLRWNRIAVIACLLVRAAAIAQQSCPNGIRIEGVVTDPSGAVIPGAEVQARENEKTTSDAAGQFVLECVPGSEATLRVQANGVDPEKVILRHIEVEYFAFADLAG